MPLLFPICRSRRYADSPSHILGRQMLHPRRSAAHQHVDQQLGRALAPAVGVASDGADRGIDVTSIRLAEVTIDAAGE